jgi:hypothetical protein
MNITKFGNFYRTTNGGFGETSTLDLNAGIGSGSPGPAGPTGPAGAGATWPLRGPSGLNDEANPIYSFADFPDAGMSAWSYGGKDYLAFISGGEVLAELGGLHSETTSVLSLYGKLDVNETVIAWGANASTPSYSFYNDEDTGIYRVGANSLGVATEGVNRLTVNNSGATVNGKTVTNTFQMSTGGATGYIMVSDGSGNAGWEENYASVKIGGTGISSTSFGHNALPISTATINDAFGGNSLASNIEGLGNVAIGYNALTSNTGGYWNTAVGYAALEKSVVGDNNTAVGTEALYNNTASNNTAVGMSALFNNVGGTRNTAMGLDSLSSNVSGNDCSAFGYHALSKTTASENSAFGAHALKNNVGGAGNVAVGHEALMTNVSGTKNTAVGRDALRLNTGSENTACGTWALQANQGSSFSSAFGSAALGVSTGQRNCAFGRESLGLNTTGTFNSAFGDRAGDANTVGAYHAIFGANADVSENNLSGCTIIGAGGLANASNQFVVALGNANKLRSDLLPVQNGATGPSSHIVLDLGGTGYNLPLGCPEFINDGTVSEPGLRFTDDPDSGMYRIGDTSFGFSQGGANRLTILTDGDNSGISTNKVTCAKLMMTTGGATGHTMISDASGNASWTPLSSMFPSGGETGYVLESTGSGRMWAPKSWLPFNVTFNRQNGSTTDWAHFYVNTHASMSALANFHFQGTANGASAPTSIKVICNLNGGLTSGTFDIYDYDTSTVICTQGVTNTEIDTTAFADVGTWPTAASHMQVRVAKGTNTGTMIVQAVHIA